VSGLKQDDKENAMFLIKNETDDVFASPDAFETEKEAEAYAKEFRARFAAQGYYLTARWERIAPEDIELVIIPAEPIE
jgi:hypothetical protein